MSQPKDAAPEPKAARRMTKAAPQAQAPAPSPAQPAPAKAKKAPAKGAAAQTPKASQPAAQPAAAKSAMEIPAILLEGDTTPGPKKSGPGSRYALGATSAGDGTGVESGELPDAYGTERIALTARDPHWLYASWDLTAEQLRRYNSLAADGHLGVRVFADRVGNGQPVAEVQVHPESRNWFIYVGHSETRFVAELGYYAKKNRAWTSISASNPTITPPDTLSDDTSVQFATIPSEISFRQLIGAVQAAAQEHLPLVDAIRQLRAAGHTNLPAQPSLPPGDWTEAQSRALAAVLTMDEVRRVWIGSLEVTELIRRRLASDIASISAAQLSDRTAIGALSSQAASSISSPFGAAPGQRGFWFNVNAELIIYGATEPDATVTIGGRNVRLRKDGSFSFRFALPDGDFALPAQAIAADGHDSRSADLEFRRATQYDGEVGAHPQDAALRPPRPEHVS